MKKAKGTAGYLRYKLHFGFVATLFISLAWQSCTKADDSELVTYTGHIWLYDGPQIGQYDEIDVSYLKPVPDVQVFIWSCQSWSGWLGSGCTPEGRMEETDVTDSTGRFSISFQARDDLSYIAEIDYQSDYLQKTEPYDGDFSQDIILVPRNLIE